MPRLLDLFCGAGGAALGYHRAGFDEIIGVDIERQRAYPFTFVQGDALEFPLEGFDLIHASPPCQRFSTMRHYRAGRLHHDLIEPVRKRLQAAGAPWVIENVEGSPLNATVVLCGSMFRSERGYLRRHRLFECSFDVPQPECRHEGKAIGVYGHGTAGIGDKKFRTAGAAEARVLMGTPGMQRDGMAQAIPPAYTEFIGRALNG